MVRNETNAGIPLDLQFFAEDNVLNEHTDGDADTTKNEGNEPNAPTVDELMIQLAKANAEKEKLKNSNDKLSKSEAEMKRQLRAKLTAEEQEAEARKEADVKRQEAYENAISELNKMKAVNAYSSVLSDESIIDSIIEAVDDKDHGAIAFVIKNACEKAVKNAQAEWLKSRPPVKAGTGTSTMTKEEILSIQDPLEQQKAIAQNLHLFK